MTRSTRQIAEEALPGWKVAKDRDFRKVKRSDLAQVRTPDIAELRRRYLGEDASAPGEGFAPASSFQNEETEYVVMEPKEPSAAGQRRVVVISGGRAVAVQG